MEVSSLEITQTLDKEGGVSQGHDQFLHTLLLTPIILCQITMSIPPVQFTGRNDCRFMFIRRQMSQRGSIRAF
jgi:hypothetical protein